MLECWASELTHRPELAVVSSRLQAIAQGQLGSPKSMVAPASQVVMNPTYSDRLQSETSTDT